MILLSIYVSSVFVREQNICDAAAPVELRYRAKLETSNPLWHVAFFLIFNSHDFIFSEISGKEDFSREITITNGGREVARIFYSNGSYGGKVSISPEYWEAELNREQAKTFFEILDFIHSAEPGSARSGNYLGKKSLYRFYVKAVKEGLPEINRKHFRALYFEALVFTSRGEKYLEAQFRLIKSGRENGRITGGVFKKKGLPEILFELQN